MQEEKKAIAARTVGPTSTVHLSTVSHALSEVAPQWGSFNFHAPQMGSPLPVNTGSILDDYDIYEDTIGYGSYSTCKRCVHRATGVECAVKVR